MSFRSDLGKFKKKVDDRHRAIFVGTVTEAHRSIVDGSEITGSPGQPVDTGTLKNSWGILWDLTGERRAHIVTNVAYAPNIEDGVSRWGTEMELRSQVGGFHSVKMTIAGMRFITEHVHADVTRGDGGR